MKRRLIIEKYKSVDDKIRYDYHNGCQYYDIIECTMSCEYLTLLLYNKCIKNNKLT